MAPIDRFVYPDARELQNILKFCNLFWDEMIINLHPEKGLTIRNMDPARVSMIVLEITPEDFEEFKIEKETSYCFDLDSVMSEVFKKKVPDTSVTFEFYPKTEKEQAHFGISMLSKNYIRKLKEFPLLDIPGDKPPGQPKIDAFPTVRMKLTACGLADILADAKDHIKISDQQIFQRTKARITSSFTNLKT